MWWGPTAEVRRQPRGAVGPAAHAYTPTHDLRVLLQRDLGEQLRAHELPHHAAHKVLLVVVRGARKVADVHVHDAEADGLGRVDS